MSDHGTSAEWRDIKFVLASMVLMLLCNIPASVFELGWQSAAFTTGLWCLIFAVYIAKFRSKFLLGWAMVGLAGGFTELIADWWLVNRTHSLVYAPDEPIIVASPAYMPFCWALILLQMGVLAHWLRGRMPAFAAAIVVGSIGGINIPIYEHLAKGANWWIYQDTPMLYNAPYYIILGEFLLVMPLVWIGGELHKRGPIKGGIVLGILEGLVILVAYIFSWWLLGPCDGAVIQLSCK